MQADRQATEASIHRCILSRGLCPLDVVHSSSYCVPDLHVCKPIISLTNKELGLLCYNKSYSSG